MEHFVLPSSWAYNPLQSAFVLRHGYSGSEKAFVLLDNLKPSRLLLIGDTKGRWKISKGVDASPSQLLSTIALRPDTFIITTELGSSEFSLHPSLELGVEEGCLIFAECRGAVTLCEEETTGSVLCAYPTNIDNVEGIAFAAWLSNGQNVAFQNAEFLLTSFEYDGEYLSITSG